MERSDKGRHLEHALIDHVAKVWREPDQGLWEGWSELRHYVPSMAMVWSVSDRILDGRGVEELTPSRRNELSALRGQMHAKICEQGLDRSLNSFTSFYGGTEVNASLLLLPKIGFLPMSNPRMAGTLDFVEAPLVEGGFARRHRKETLVPKIVSFAYSSWLAECRFSAGRRRDAVEAAIGLARLIGRLSQVYEIQSRWRPGNHLQAPSHLALIQAVLPLRRPDGQTGRHHADL